MYIAETYHIAETFVLIKNAIRTFNKAYAHVKSADFV